MQITYCIVSSIIAFFFSKIFCSIALPHHYSVCQVSADIYIPCKQCSAFYSLVECFGTFIIWWIGHLGLLSLCKAFCLLWTVDGAIVLAKTRTSESYCTELTSTWINEVLSCSFVTQLMLSGGTKSTMWYKRWNKKYLSPTHFV